MTSLLITFAQTVGIKFHVLRVPKIQFQKLGLEQEE